MTTVPDLYDTTLRDGTQGPGMSLTVADKLAVARLLDAFGVDFIEGGWPGAIPRDTDFFRRAAGELTLRNARLAAFGATRRPDRRAARDPQVTALLAAETPVVTLVAKSDSRHVERALRTTAAENLAMVGDTVSFLVGQGREVFVDCEHFFDGFAADPEHALDVVRAAVEAGANTVVLCDTNGGSLPETVAAIVAETAGRTGARLGIHCHDDSGCGVANTLAAVDAGVAQTQLTAHGYGERCGNANLFTVAANLVLKKGLPVLSEDQLASMAETAIRIAEVAGVSPRPGAPYVGPSAFAHKAGLHASALRVDTGLYQHVEPSVVGNRMQTLVSDMAGRASVELKADELGHDLSGRSDVLGRLVDRIKRAEQDGLSYESADASFELVLHEELAGGPLEPPFRVQSWEVGADGPGDGTRAAVTVTAGGRRQLGRGTGADATTALDHALRAALQALFPQSLTVRRRTLLSQRLRALPATAERGELSRVLVSHGEGARTWTAVGLHHNPVVAGLRALVENYHHALLDRTAAPAPARLTG